MSAALSRVRHCNFVNTFGLADLAIKQLRRIPYLIVPHDTDAGFAFVHVSQARGLELPTLPESHYQPVPMQCINFRTLRALFGGLANTIEAYEDSPGMASSIARPLG